MTVHSGVPAAAAQPDLMGRIFEGNQYLRAGRVEDAAAVASDLVAEFPQHARAHAFAAEVRRLLDDYDGAVAAIDRAIALADDPQHRIKKAWLLSRMLRRDEIPALAEEAAQLGHGDGRVHWQVAKLYAHHNRLDDAIRHYLAALKAVGENPSWRYDLAIAYFYSGDADRAEEELGRVLQASPQAGAVLYLRSTLRRQTIERNHVADLERRLRGGLRNADDESGALYALAKELEDLGEYPLSFDALRKGAGKKRSTLNYDPAAFRNTMDEIRRVQDAEALSRADAGCDAPGAIFIVGMPRTGTTLAERMLLQSGKVEDAGELMDFGFLVSEAVLRIRAASPGVSHAQATMRIDFASLGQRYMQAARQMARGNGLFIDKLPPNYMYCGLIHKALPRARIIHLVRDPLDTCYAIYKTLFFNAYEFSYDLEELADYYIEYRKTMRHWHDAMPGVILDVNYEDLVTDTEAQARRIYDWCGLDWTPDALRTPDRTRVFATASAAQVREPVHTRSIHSSRRHLEGLAPLAKRLSEAGLFDA